MAIMRRCCCFGDTRSGSLAAGIYSLIYTIIYLGLNGWSFSGISVFTTGIVLYMYYIQFVAYGIALVGSILMIIGATKDISGLVLAYAICFMIMMLIEITSYIIWLSILGFLAILLILPFIIYLILLTFNIMCVLCAISQYQELSAGRGRIEDVTRANTTTTVIMTTGQPVMTHQPPPGTFIVQQQPPAYGQQTTVVQQGGYGQPVPMQQGYGQPAVQQGYSQPPPPVEAGYGHPAAPEYPPGQDSKA